MTDDLAKIGEARLGRVLRGKYRLDRILGVGGMAVVYAATHRNKKRVAIKMLHPALSLQENLRTRFLREGYVANSVGHPGAVAVADDDVAEDGSAFIVMELLDGEPLDALAGRHASRLPLPLVLSIGHALLDVLAAAHAQGIVHRDLKPANLFLTSDGALKVLDFGIARLRDETGGDATATGAMLGTPAFMAPEQAAGQSSDIDAQTDLWAAGATLFTLASGSLVHDGNNAQQLMIAAATKPARPLKSVLHDAPSAIAAVVDRALAFSKKERWADARAMRDALASASLGATGTAIAPLPKGEVGRSSGAELVSGDDATVSADGASRPNKDAFGSTVAADAIKAGGTNAVVVADSAARTQPASRLRWLFAVALAAAAGVAAIAFGARSRSIQPTTVRPTNAAATTATAIPNDGYDTLFPCARTQMDTSSISDARSCSDEEIAWCAQTGKAEACCPVGLVALRTDGECGCPPGGRTSTGPGRADEFGCTGAGGPLTSDVIQGVVHADIPQLRKCYEAGLARVPGLKGRVSVYFEIAPHGEVFYTRLKGTTLADAEAQHCMLSIFSKLRFPPPPDGTVTVVYPVSFAAGD